MAHDSVTLKTLAQSWLAHQCEALPNVKCGMVALGVSGDANVAPTAYWPNGAEPNAALIAAAELAVNRLRPVVKAIPHGSKPSLEVACPVLTDGRLFGVAAVETETSGEQQQAVMRLMQWGVSWLEFIVQRETSGVIDRTMTVLEMVATVLEHERFQAAAMAAATELTRRLDCERVSIGFVSGRHMEVRAFSHSARFSQKSNLLRDIGTAMDESLDQDATIVYPPVADEQPQVTKAHAVLARRHGAGAICTVPFSASDQIIGAVTFERAQEQYFDTPTVEMSEAIVALLGPILESKRKHDLWIGAKIGRDIRDFFKRLFGPRHPILKLAALLLIGCVYALFFTTASYRVSALAMLEGAVQRAVVAPTDGFIAAAYARAGDIVQAGQALGILDDTNLKLERLKWASERDQLVREHRSALAAHKRAESSILSARIARAEAQIALLDEQLARTQFVAPIDGIIVSGDLSQALGSPVERGQVLFEVAPRDAFRVILNIDEREISAIAVRQRGNLALTAVPGREIPFTVEKITPVSVVEQGRNFFRVEARLETQPELLRPGMQGVGKVEIDRRSLGWILTRKLRSWIQLWLWTWWP